MKIKQYIELDKKFHDKTFAAKYGPLDVFLNISSYLGNLASIFFAYWFTSKLLLRAMSDFPGREIGIVLISIVALGMFEAIKRFVLKGLCVAFIQSKKFSVEVIYNLVFSVILLSGSFYLSLSGAKIFADKSEEVKEQVEITTSAQTDSIITLYDGKIQYKLKDREDLRKNKNAYVRQMEKVGVNTYRLREFKLMINEVNKEIGKLDTAIMMLEEEKKKEISYIKTESKAETETKSKQIFQNQIAFIIISSFIELLILVGIWFHSFFRLKVYDEYRENIENNSNYEMYMDFSKILNMLYRHGKAPPQTELPPMNTFMASVRKREDFSHNYIKECVDICKDLGIVAVNQKKKTIIIKKYSEAKELLLDYFEDDD